MTRDELIRYAAERFSAEAEYPWDDVNFILRHRGNRKWFAVAMQVPYRKLGLDREGTADIADVKCSPLLMGAYRSQPGILPGYHMNKEHWLTILLDGSAADETVKELLELSYDLTAETPRQGAARLRRIGRYEAILDEMQTALADPGISREALADLGDKVRELERYYGSDLWKRDFAADEAGLLPSELKRGILSEDGVWNALETYRERLERQE